MHLAESHWTWQRCNFPVPFVAQDAPKKTVEGARSSFMSAMSDSGLKPTVVYHNLTPAELYEKVH